MAKINNFEDIKISADTIGEAGHERDIIISKDVLHESIAESDIKALSPLKIHYTLSRHEDKVTALVHIEAQVEVTCSRCISPIKYDVDLDLKTTYLPATSDMYLDLEAERTSPEIGYYRKDVPLGEYILSELVLSLPLRYVCSDKCKGLCDQCGANLNENKCSCPIKGKSGFDKLAEMKNKFRRM